METPHTSSAPLGGMKRLPRLSDRDKIRALLARLIGLNLHGKLSASDLKTLTYSLSELHRITEDTGVKEIEYDDEPEGEMPPFDAVRGCFNPPGGSMM
jgi:hypothetical protein